MTIKLNGKEIELNLYGYRMEMIWENKFNCTLDLHDVTSTKIANLFWCVVLSNLEKLKLDLISFEDFQTAIEDENEGDITYVKFYIWYISQKTEVDKLLHEEIEKLTKEQPKKA